MSMINPYLVIDSYDRTDKYSKSRGPIYKAAVDGEAIFSLDCSIPIIDTRKRACIGVAMPFEYHVSKKVTIVFFTIDEANEKAKKAFYSMYLSNNGGGTPASGARPYAETAGTRGTSTIDPAMAMAMGKDRAVEQIADRAAGRRDVSVEDILGGLHDSSRGYDEDLY